MNDTNQPDTPEPAGGFAGGAEGIGGPDSAELSPGMSPAGDIMAADGDSPGEGASGSGAGRGGKKVKKKPAQEKSSGEERKQRGPGRHGRGRGPRSSRKGGGGRPKGKGRRHGRRASGAPAENSANGNGALAAGGARDETRNLPKVPAGEDGIVYVIGGFAPLAGEGYIEMYDRKRAVKYAYNYFTEEYEAAEDINLVPVSTDRGLVNRLTDPLDRQIATLVTRLPKARTLAANAASKKTRKGSRPGRKGAPNNHYGKAALLRSAACYVSEDNWRRLIPLLIETGRVYVEPAAGLQAMPLELETLDPYEFQLSLEFGNRSGEYHLTGRFVRDKRQLPFESHALLVADGEKGYLVRKSGRLTEIDFMGSASWLRALRRGRYQRVSRRSLGKLYKVFERSTTLPPLRAPANLSIKMVRDEVPRPELKLEQAHQGVTGEVIFRYGKDDSVRTARPGRCFFSSRT
ncbi:MAG: hypothetical protein VX496_09120, partial [Planctomycetota bacterium]|nr:hypothetical protein [Planctomycetota bacterium]